MVAWGLNLSGQCNVGGNWDATAIAAGTEHTVALRRGGTVVTFGNATESGPPGLSGVKAIAAGYHCTLALKEDGRVVVWGTGLDFEKYPPPAFRARLIAAHERRAFMAPHHEHCRSGRAVAEDNDRGGRTWVCNDGLAG